MFFAEDKEGKRTHITDTELDAQYFCPSCGELLVLKKNGTIYAPHFSHYPGTICKDTWHYDMSNWHINWQNRFPISCQEIVKKIGDQKHRADVLIEECKIVIEFQHSNLSKEEFEDRNNFYNELGYKVIWVFDVAEQYDNETLFESYIPGRGVSYQWKHAKSTFNGFQLDNNKVELYLQFENSASDNKAIQDYLDHIEKTGPDILPNSFMKRYYEDHKNDKGFLKKVNWISFDGIKEFTTLEKDISIENFVSDFSYYITLNNNVNRDELCDYLKYIKQKDHTQYYDGCPISKTGQCVTSRIDIPESMYSDIMPCEICEYKGKDYMTCTKRIKDLNIPEQAIIKGYCRNNDGFIDKIKFEDNGVMKSIQMEVKLKKSNEQIINTDKKGNIFDLWRLNNLSIATFKDIKNNRFVRINKDPYLQRRQYGRVFGKMSNDQYSFKGESVEIYYTNDERWILVWGIKKE